MASTKTAAAKPAGKRTVKAAAKPRQMTRAAVRGFIEALAAANPAPESELEYDTPFTLLAAVVLSAQATDKSVNRVTQTLFAEAPTPEAMVRLGVDDVAQHIRSIGLWQTKAHNVVELSRQLLAKHGGEVPPDRKALEALRGVGRKTANVVLNVAFRQDIPGSPDNPEFLWVNDAKIVGDLIAPLAPVRWHVLAQKGQHRGTELTESDVTLVVSCVSVHQSP